MNTKMIIYQIHLIDTEEPIEILADDFEIRRKANAVCFIRKGETLDSDIYLAYFPLDRITAITYRLIKENSDD